MLEQSTLQKKQTTKHAHIQTEKQAFSAEMVGNYILHVRHNCKVNY